MSSAEKKILFILYNFPPDFGTAPVRNYSIAKHLAAKFSQAFLVTKENATIFPLFTKVIRNKRADYRYFISTRTSSGYLPESLKKNPFSKYAIKLLNTFPFNLLIGEGGGSYLDNTIRDASKLIRQEKITHIYSSYRPFTDHYAARILKKKFPQLVWIADFRDLIVDPHYKQQFMPGQHDKFYHKFFRKADLLITISEGFRRKLALQHPHTLTVLNGIEQLTGDNNPVRSERFTITYTGSMFLEERNPRPLLNVLKKLLNTGKIDKDKIRIIYAGKDITYWQEVINKYELNSVFEYKGLLSREASLQLQNAANINLLLTISTGLLDGVLTGKMIEYLQSLSNTLVIIRHQRDLFIKEIFDELNAGLVVDDLATSETIITDFILDKYNRWLQTGLVEKPVDSERLLQLFSWETTLKPLFEYIDGN